MSFAKKMMLVPSEALWGTADPIARKVSRLDQEMQDVLSRTDLDDYTKAKLYNQILQNYLDTKQKLTVATPVQMTAGEPPQSPLTEKTPQPSTDPPKSDLNKEVLDSIPQNLKGRAQRLMQYVGRLPNTSWNEQGELVINNKPVHGSHAIDLVRDMIENPKRKDYLEPKGWDELTQSLASQNVPMALIGNKKRWQQIQMHKNLKIPQTPKTPIKIGRSRSLERVKPVDLRWSPY